MDQRISLSGERFSVAPTDQAQAPPSPSRSTAFSPISGEQTDQIAPMLATARKATMVSGVFGD
jgi:hypothetical protein